MDTSSPQLQVEIADFMRAAKLQQLVTDTTLNLPIDLLINHSTSLYNSLVTTPTQFIPLLETQISTLFNKKISLNLTQPLLKSSQKSPKDLKSADFLTLTSVYGIVKKSNQPTPKLQTLVTFENDEFKSTNFADPTIEMNVTKTNSYIPRTQQPKDNLYGLSTFTTAQKLFLQDPPEISASKIPKTICCVLQQALIDSVRPGDRVFLTGVYLPLPHKNDEFGSLQKTTSGFLLIFGKFTPGIEFFIPKISWSGKFNLIANLPSSAILNLLAVSFASSLKSQNYVKKALILLLLSNSTQDSTFRSSINILLTGPPGTGKSQFLRQMSKISPICVQTSAKSASAAGLTASVINNQIEAGAFVLADSGVLTIDEFDKMSQNDRNSIHEAMEQQVVSINKANIHIQLNCRCSVVGAANFVFGAYDEERTISENLGMPESLVSRFDLIFRIEDDISQDSSICGQVFRNRCGKVEQQVVQGGKIDKTAIFGEFEESCFQPFQESFNAEFEQFQLYNTPSLKMSKNRFLLQNQFIKDIIQQCKFRNPALNQAVCDKISQYYSQLRYNSINKNQLVTARVLESMIRLAVSAAKLNATEEVTVENVDMAYILLRMAYFGETEKEATKQIKQDFQVDKYQIFKEIFTDFCIEKEEKFTILEFKKKWKSEMKAISLKVTEKEFEEMMQGCLKEVEGVYEENGVVYM